MPSPGARPGHHRGRALDGLVARGMPERVVQILEAVEVHRHDAAARPRLGSLPIRHVHLERVAVLEPCQVVGVRHVAVPRVRHPPEYEEGHHDGQQAEQRGDDGRADAHGLERVVLMLRVELDADDPDHPAVVVDGIVRHEHVAPSRVLDVARVHHLVVERALHVGHDLVLDEVARRAEVVALRRQPVHHVHERALIGALRRVQVAHARGLLHGLERLLHGAVGRVVHVLGRIDARERGLVERVLHVLVDAVRALLERAEHVAVGHLVVERVHAQKRARHHHGHDDAHLHVDAAQAALHASPPRRHHAPPDSSRAVRSPRSMSSWRPCMPVFT